MLHQEAFAPIFSMSSENVSRTKTLENYTNVLSLLDSYEGNYLFIGHGSKSQYANFDEVRPKLDSLVETFNSRHGKGRWLAIFGGDNVNPQKPDIAHVMQYLREHHEVPLLAIQSDVVIKKWGSAVDPHVDYAYYVETDYFRDAGGEEKIQWGGTKNGRLLGPTRVYLGDDFTQGPRPRLQGLIAIGGGPI